MNITLIINKDTKSKKYITEKSNNNMLIFIYNKIIYNFRSKQNYSYFYYYDNNYKNYYENRFSVYFDSYNITISKFPSSKIISGSFNSSKPNIYIPYIYIEAFYVYFIYCKYYYNSNNSYYKKYRFRMADPDKIITEFYMCVPANCNTMKQFNCCKQYRMLYYI